MRSLITLITVGLALTLTSCMWGESVHIVTLEELESYQPFEITLRGDTILAYLSDDTCHYTEWAYNERLDSGWTELTSGYQTDKPLRIITPYGEATLNIYQIRTYLGAYHSRTFERGNAAIAPAPMRQALERADKMLYVREYLLSPNRSYWARVGKARYFAPADSPGAAPIEKYTLVLEISDKPFKGGAPDRELTPAYQGSVY